MDSHAVPSLRPRADDAHKGTFGHALIVAGSREMAGAACLATLAALRSGVGLVTCATAESVQSVVAGRAIAAMTLPLPQGADGVVDGVRAVPALSGTLAKTTAVAAGPGLSHGPGIRALMAHLLDGAHGRPLLLDADALNALAAMQLDAGAVLPTLPDAVLTPHPKEFARLSGQTLPAILADPAAAARLFVRDLPGVTLVLKGHRTVVARHGEPVWQLGGAGNSGLAKGGTGDVLTGLMVGLLAQGYEARDAAVLAVHLHARAGRFAADAIGPDGMTAEDVITFLPAAFVEHRQRVTE